MIDFVHLHNHSEFSLLDSTNRVDWIASRVKDAGMNSIALTDHGTAAGWVEFQSSCKKVGVKPILGIEAYQAVSSRFEKGGYYHLILLAQDEVGYKNLLRLSYHAATEGFYRKPRIDKELIKAYSNGVICMSACLASETSRKIVTAAGASYEGEDSQELSLDPESVESTIEWYKKVFGDRYYLELQLNGIDIQNTVNKKLVEMSAGFNIPLVLTNDCHYTNPQHNKLHEVMFCIRDRKVLSDPDRYKFSGGGYWIKTPSEVQQSIETEFGDISKEILYKAAEQTAEISARCNASTPTGKFFFPQVNVPSSPEESLARLASEGLKAKGFEDTAVYQERMEYELGVICKLGFAPYFLVVADYMNWARENDILTGPGRGSAAGCLVAYLTNITSIDPIKYDLYFERFLNESRVSPPDIDSDFADRDRERVLEYLKNKYGHDKVVNIATYGSMAAKSAVRNAAFVLGYDFNTSTQVAEYVPEDRRGIHAKLSEIEIPKEAPKEVHEVFELARQLEGSIRTQSVHASGVVIAPSHIADFAPVCRTSSEGVAVEWDMNEIEKAGLIKFDILGLRNLSVISDCLALIKKRRGIDVNLNAIPSNDKEAFRLICEGNVVGIFQLEASSGIAALAKKLAPKTVVELSNIIALYRPGPLDTILGNYVLRKEGKEEIDYPLGLDKELEPVLGYTYGLYVYQEQIMKMAQIISGYTLIEADNLRKAIGKKNREEMAKHKERFISGRREGVSEKGASELFDDISHFADYCFNKSHSLAYATLGLWTAYLKAHFNIEFQTALINSEVLMSNDLESRAIYIEDALKQGIKVLLPSVNVPMAGCVIEEENQIRLGLSCIKGLSVNAANHIREEFEKSGPYKSISNFFIRMNNSIVRSNTAESLAKVGAFDWFGDRNKIIANVNEIRATVLALKSNNFKVDYEEIFEEINGRPPKKNELVEIELKEKSSPYDKNELETSLIGFSPSKSSSPLSTYLHRFKWNNSEDLEKGIEQFTGVGILTSIKEIITKKTNQQMAFLQFKINGRNVEIVAFPQVWSISKPLLAIGSWYVLVLNKSKESYSLTKIQTCESFVEQNAEGVACCFESPDGFNQLKEMSFNLKEGDSREIIILVAPFWGAKQAIKLVTKKSVSELVEILTSLNASCSIL